MTDSASAELNIDWRGEGGGLLAGDRADTGAVSVADSAVDGGCCSFTRATAARVGSAGGRAVWPSRVFASAFLAIAKAAADKPDRSSVPGAGVISNVGAAALG